jgi:hypothetical protein
MQKSSTIVIPSLQFVQVPLQVLSMKINTTENTKGKVKPGVTFFSWSLQKAEHTVSIVILVSRIATNYDQATIGLTGSTNAR